MPSNKALLLLLLIAACLLQATIAQKGGGWTSSSRSSWFKTKSKKKTSTNCTTVDGQTTCYPQQSSSSFGFTTILAGVFLVGIKIYEYWNKTNNQAKKKEIFENTMKDFTQRMEQDPSRLDQSARQQMIKSLKGKSFNMVVTTRANKDSMQCRLTVGGLEPISNYQYQIWLTGMDEIGQSRFQGLLIFSGDGFTLKLSKQYQDKKKAKQMNGFESLFYEGFGQPDHLSGKWAFHGQEAQPQYSGNWSAVPA